MDAIFKICKQAQCNILVTGLEISSDQYQNDADLIVSYRNYGWKQTVTVNAIISVNADGEETYQSHNVVLHDTDCMDEDQITLPLDGLFQVSHMIIPTADWIRYVEDREPKAFDMYEMVYFYDITSKAFYKYINHKAEKVDINEVLEIDSCTSTIIREDKSTFTICHLMECFYNLCKNLLGAIPGQCSKNLDSIKAQIANRDIIWMAINVIKYLIELGQYFEAQRILESVTQCGGICRDITVKSNKGGGCGCNQKS